MKNVLLLAYFACSMKSTAQNFQPPINLRHQIPILMEDVSASPENAGEKIYGIYADENFGKPIQHQTTKQHSPIQLNDSIYIWGWDALIAEWTFESKIVNIVYDVNNNLISEVFQKREGSAWSNYKRETSAFDANNNKTSYLSQDWSGTMWMNSSQEIYTYDVHNNQTSELIQYWDGSDWINSYQYTYTYDVNNNKISILLKKFEGSVWHNSYLSTYIYDASNNLTLYTFQEWSGGWLNLYKYAYTYNTHNKLTFLTHHGWNRNTSKWVKSLEETYSYDVNDNLVSILFQTGVGYNTDQKTFVYDIHNNQTSELWQKWENNAWVNYLQNINTYDANNNQTSKLSQNWNGSNWVNTYKYNYSYDANNNQISELWQNLNGSDPLNSYQLTYSYDANNFLQSKATKFFDNTGIVLPCVFEGRIVCIDSTYYYFHTLSGVEELKGEDDGVSVYPNPNSGKFTISSKKSIGTIEIYNLLGERIYSNPDFNQQSYADIDLTNHAKGIFIIYIYDGKIIYNRKIVVQ